MQIMNLSYRFGWLTYLTKQTWYRKHLVTKQEVLWHLFFIGIVGMAELNHLFYVYLKTFPSWNISKIAQFILLRGFCKSFWRCLIHCIALVSDILYGLRQSGPMFFFPWAKKVFTPASYTGGPVFKSRPGDRISWLGSFAVLDPPKKMPL
jgi:hypothetical protein